MNINGYDYSANMAGNFVSGSDGNSLAGFNLFNGNYISRENWSASYDIYGDTASTFFPSIIWRSVGGGGIFYSQNAFGQYTNYTSSLYDSNRPTQYEFNIYPYVTPPTFERTASYAEAEVVYQNFTTPTTGGLFCVLMFDNNGWRLLLFRITSVSSSGSIRTVNCTLVDSQTIAGFPPVITTGIAAGPSSVASDEHKVTYNGTTNYIPYLRYLKLSGSIEGDNVYRNTFTYAKGIQCSDTELWVGHLEILLNTSSFGGHPWGNTDGADGDTTTFNIGMSKDGGKIEKFSISDSGITTIQSNNVSGIVSSSFVGVATYYDDLDAEGLSYTTQSQRTYTLSYYPRIYANFTADADRAFLAIGHSDISDVIENHNDKSARWTLLDAYGFNPAPDSFTGTSGRLNGLYITQANKGTTYNQVWAQNGTRWLLDNTNEGDTRLFVVITPDGFMYRKGQSLSGSSLLYRVNSINSPVADSMSNYSQPSPSLYSSLPAQIADSQYGYLWSGTFDPYALSAFAVQYFCPHVSSYSYTIGLVTQEAYLWKETSTNATQTISIPPMTGVGEIPPLRQHQRGDNLGIGVGRNTFGVGAAGGSQSIQGSLRQKGQTFLYDVNGEPIETKKDVLV